MNTFMELAKSYAPQEIEQRWYQFWKENQYFVATLDEQKEAYCIMLPPPNVTGTLHMGHAFQSTIMDMLIRYQRMQGKNVLWQPGTDHAGIATQMVVERQLELKGTDRHALGREKFVERVWEWKKESGSSITKQMYRLGASCDWSRERFTLDEGLSEAVLEVFVRLHEEGLIYRGKRLVNWDPILHTALSDLEVVSQEEDGKMWHIRYPLKDNPTEGLVVATTRPETLLGDVAVAVSPTDERYQHLIGQVLILPLSGREIPIIADEYVDPSFGTGCVKITPAHDFNDYAVGQRHHLPQINILSFDAKLLAIPEVPACYQNLDRFAARQKMVADLEAQGLLVEIKPHKLMVPRGDRSHAIVEPMLTDQWFMKMEGLAARALEVVKKGEIKFVPENWTTTYNQWLENIQDWCISRQLWWGHRIPAWYDDQGHIYVARSAEEAQAKAGADVVLTQDNDVLDTWFSSALWTFSTLGFPKQTKELEIFAPSSVLVTGFDIIFFWVARMIMMTLHFTDKVPFKTVYVHGLVRDSEGQKMSKSKGNVLDPLDLIEGIQLENLVGKRTVNLMNPKQAEQIEKRTRQHFPDGIPAFGTDALRFTFASLASHGRDIKFDLNRCEGYRNFCNKVWNATRFVLMNCEEKAITRPLHAACGFAERWILYRLNQTVAEIRRQLDDYRFDLASRALYEFVWDEYCDWYLELAKVTLKSEDQDVQNATRYVLIDVLETILRLAHPIIPFMTEELWQAVAPLIKANNTTTIMLAPYPEVNTSLIQETDFIEGANTFHQLKGMVNACRELRGEMNISPAQRVPLALALGENAPNLKEFVPYLAMLAKLERVDFISESELSEDAPTLVIAEVKDIKLQLQIEIDREAEKTRLEKEISRLTTEINKAQVKLNNPAFVQKAPEKVVTQEKARLVEFQTLLDKITNQYEKLR